jgi:hypothetical protein|uniref:ERF superfamily protein n=1 Tax=Phage sp. ctXnn1 TaxID=2826749 RepID=A0A8S5N9U7_9VIRU|nr:MAG TPA: ERF superfamily protein [Phage sp. ctXnn1]
MAEKKNIFETINAVMEEIGAVGKNSRNEKQNYMYRGVDDVMNALNPAFIKHKLFMVPEVVSQKREERQTANGKNTIYSVLSVKYTFYAEDGSSIYTIVPGEGMDSGDKASNKAMSSAFKYACFQVFCIPTEEMQDPDAETPPPSIPVYATDQMRDTFLAECKRIGKPAKAILKFIGAPSLAELTVKQFETAMMNFKKTPSAPTSPPANVPDKADEGLPRNEPTR